MPAILWNELLKGEADLIRSLPKSSRERSSYETKDSSSFHGDLFFDLLCSFCSCRYHKWLWDRKLNLHITGGGEERCKAAARGCCAEEWSHWQGGSSLNPAVKSQHRSLGQEFRRATCAVQQRDCTGKIFCCVGWEFSLSGESAEIRINTKFSFLLAQELSFFSHSINS